MPAPPLKPLSIGEVLDTAFGLYRALFLPLLLVTLGTTAVPMAISVYIEAAGGTFEHLPLATANLVLNVVLGSIGSAATTIIVAESYLHRTVAAGEAFRRATPFLGRIIVAAFLSTLLMGLGLLLLIIPGFIVAAGLAVTTPAMVVENQDSALSAMGRSWSLTRGHRRRILGVLGIVLTLMYIPVLALGGYAATRVTEDGAAGLAYSPEGLALNALAAVLTSLVQPLFYSALTVIYYDLRVRKEAYDLELLAAGMTAP